MLSLINHTCAWLGLELGRGEVYELASKASFLLHAVARLIIGLVYISLANIGLVYLGVKEDGLGKYSEGGCAAAVVLLSAVLSLVLGYHVGCSKLMREYSSPI